MYVKVCGITSLEDGEAAVAAGADALGINLVPSSKRYVEPALAERLLEQLAPQALCIVVVARRSLAELVSLSARCPYALLQLHGDEPPELLERLGTRAFKAVRIGGAEDVAFARGYGSHPLLVDAKVGTELGGTGHTVDWSLVSALARERPVVLAGGLTPGNVAEAICQVRPWAVDVASGVEVTGDARRKDPDKLARFIAAARAASDAIAGSSPAFSGTSWRLEFPAPRRALEP